MEEVVRFTLLQLCLRAKRSRIPAEKRLIWLQSRSDQYAEKKLLDLSGLELRYLGRPARSQSIYLQFPRRSHKQIWTINKSLLNVAVISNHEVNLARGRNIGHSQVPARLAPGHNLSFYFYGCVSKKYKKGRILISVRPNHL
jgi:hypothetical protein